MVRLIDITPAEQAARIRAAVGFSGEEYRAIAKRLGVSYATLRRRAARGDPSGAGSMEELYAIAEACGVPRAFMEEGFARFAPSVTADDRLTRLEALVESQTRQGHRLQEQLDQLRQDVVQNRAAIRDEILPVVEARLEELALEAVARAQSPVREADRRQAGRRRAG